MKSRLSVLWKRQLVALQHGLEIFKGNFQL